MHTEEGGTGLYMSNDHYTFLLLLTPVLEFIIASSHLQLYETYQWRVQGGAPGARAPPSALAQQPDHSSVATLYADNQQLVARTNNELKIRFVSNVLGAVA